MNARFASEDEIEIWDKLILSNPDGGNIVQGKVLAAIKESSGWNVRYIVVENIAITAL